jgi:hypothetical protein
MSLLREIQILLERTYSSAGVNLEECVIGSGRCADLSRQAGRHAQHLSGQGRTFLRHAGDRLYIAIFYSQPLIVALEENDPRRSLNERNIAPLITFIEEIAHGVQASLLFQAGERDLESEHFARNLEVQAKIDTYLVLSKFIHFFCGSPAPGRVRRWLNREVFDKSYCKFKSAKLRERYGASQDLAEKFLRYLKTVPRPKRQKVLRKFRAASWTEKIQFCKQVSPA